MMNLDSTYKEFAFLTMSEMIAQMKEAGIDTDSINHVTRTACTRMFRDPSDIETRLGIN
jgi:hypothetical protein